MYITIGSSQMGSWKAFQINSSRKSLPLLPSWLLQSFLASCNKIFNVLLTFEPHN